MELALQHTKENAGFREYLNSSKDNMFVFDLSKYSLYQIKLNSISQVQYETNIIIKWNKKKLSTQTKREI